MPTDLHKNDQVYTMVAEGEIAQLLSQFSDGYVMDVIDQKLANRFNYNPVTTNANLVASFEMNFKDMMNRFPNDTDNTMNVRHDTYLTIIAKICGTYGLQYVGNDPDLFSIAYNLYDMLISGYARNVVAFFSNYIYLNRNVLYANMGLEKYKKSKDSSSNYLKKVFNDPVTATVISRIKDVIYYISGFDIQLYQFLASVYQPTIADFIIQRVQPTGAVNIFKDEFCARVMENPTLMTEIRANLQQMMENDLQLQQQAAEQAEQQQQADQSEGDEPE